MVICANTLLLCTTYLLILRYYLLFLPYLLDFDVRFHDTLSIEISVASYLLRGMGSGREVGWMGYNHWGCVFLLI